MKKGLGIPVVGFIKPPPQGKCKIESANICTYLTDSHLSRFVSLSLHCYSINVSFPGEQSSYLLFPVVVPDVVSSAVLHATCLYFPHLTPPAPAHSSTLFPCIAYAPAQMPCLTSHISHPIYYPPSFHCTTPS